jgi:hypothetical protein
MNVHLFVNQEIGGTKRAPKQGLSLEVFSRHAIKVAGRDATLFEICAQSRMDRDHFCPAFHTVLFRHARRGIRA